MKFIRDLLPGFLTGILTIFLVIGAFSLSLIEGTTGQVLPTQPASPTLPGQETAFFQAISTWPPTPIIPTLPAAPTTCSRPTGWEPYQISANDSMESLSRTYNISIELLKISNCLVSNILIPGTVIYLPPLQPTSTLQPTEKPTTTHTAISTATLCSPPTGWVRYIVKANDTLFSIGMTYGTDVYQLQSANCMGTSTLIYTGQAIYVPNVSPRRTVTKTPTASNTPQPTSPPPTDDLTATSAAGTASAAQALTETAQAINADATAQAQTATAQSLLETSQAQTAEAYALTQTSLSQTQTAQAGAP